MDAPSFVAIVDRLEQEGVDVWIDGGWGVDALLGDETRQHDDLGLVAELRHADRIVELLVGLVHAGDELGEKDYRELKLLRDRFSVALPSDVRGGVEEIT